MHKAPDRQEPREVANAHRARRPEHHCFPPVPIRARIVWADTGEEVWIETVAAGWSGRLVYVDATPVRPPYGSNYVWLEAADVQRL